MTLARRAVVVHRRTELLELIARHGTSQQAAFFLRQRGRDIDEVEHRHGVQQAAMTAVANAIPLDWRRGEVERADLSRFVFGPEDVVVAVGQDGIVANVAKYLSGQPVVGIDPEPHRNPGVLVPHRAAEAVGLLAAVASVEGAARVHAKVMVEATVDDGQVLRALNEIYLGHPSHQSSRYRIETPEGVSERHSSSGILIGTGTGATGWCRSVARERNSPLVLPAAEETKLCWFVREAWPSPVTGTDVTEGLLQAGQQLVVTAESDLVLFGDGIEADALHLSWGQRATLAVSPQRLHLVV